MSPRGRNRGDDRYYSCTLNQLPHYLLLCAGVIAHCGYDSFVYNHAALKVTGVYKIVLDSFTGKRRFAGKLAQ